MLALYAVSGFTYDLSQIQAYQCILDAFKCRKNEFSWEINDAHSCPAEVLHALAWKDWHQWVVHFFPPVRNGLQRWDAGHITAIHKSRRAYTLQHTNNTNMTIRRCTTASGMVCALPSMLHLVVILNALHFDHAKASVSVSNAGNQCFLKSCHTGNQLVDCFPQFKGCLDRCESKTESHVLCNVPGAVPCVVPCDVPCTMSVAGICTCVHAILQRDFCRCVCVVYVPCPHLWPHLVLCSIYAITSCGSTFIKRRITQRTYPYLQTATVISTCQQVTRQHRQCTHSLCMPLKNTYASACGGREVG